MAIVLYCVACNNTNSTFTEYIKSYSKDTVLSADDVTTIEWKSARLDLGKSKRGPDIDMEFQFKNTGKKPLVIDSAFVACGCTEFSLPEQPVMPGKRGIIKARYISKDQPLAHNIKEIYLRANTSNSAYHTLAFKIELTEDE